jgi:hypothetical protein
MQEKLLLQRAIYMDRKALEGQSEKLWFRQLRID